MRPHTKGSRACRLCRDQKRRCNGEQPCSLCIKKNCECIFEPWIGTNQPSPSSQKVPMRSEHSIHAAKQSQISAKSTPDHNRTLSDSEALYTSNGNENGGHSSSSMSNIGPMRTQKLTSQIRTNPIGNAPTPPDSHSLGRPSTHSTEPASSPRPRQHLPSWHSRSPFNIPTHPSNPYAARSPHGSSLPGSTTMHTLPPPSLPHHYQQSHHHSHSGPTPGGSSSHTDSPDNRAANVQSNSGVLFAASIAADLGARPTNGRDEGPFIAWNLGLRNACSTSSAQTQPWSKIIHRRVMMKYLETYENVMHPIYRFINVDEVAHLVDSNHGQDQRQGNLLDAIMCGIAAIGSLFSDSKDLTLEITLEQNVRAILDAHAEDEHHLPEAACAWLLRTLYLRASKVPHACWHASCIVMHACERARLHIEETVSIMRNTGIAPVLDPRRTYHVAKLLNTWISFELGRTHVSLARASTLLPDMSNVGSESSVTMLHLFDLSLNLEPSATPSHERLLDILQEVIDVPCPSPVVVLSQAMVVLSIVRRLRFGLGLQLSTDTTALILSIGQKGMTCTNEIINTNGGPWWHIATLPYQVLCTVMALNTRKALTLVPTIMDTIRNVHSRYPTQMMDRILKRSLALVHALHKHKLDDARLLNKALGRRLNERSSGQEGLADRSGPASVVGNSPSSQILARTPPNGGAGGVTENGQLRSHSDQDLPPHMIRQKLFSSNMSGGVNNVQTGNNSIGNANGNPVEKSTSGGGGGGSGSGMVWEGRRIDLEDWLVNIDWDSIMQNTEPTFFDATGTV
jgi:Fungal Zn(2)-Cys(6) binuclear cluster domain